jgi:hypothetical protein
MSGPNLKNLDVEFLLDKSASMLTADCPGGKSRWDYARETAVGLATAVQKFDQDGIVVVPFAGKCDKVYEGVTADKVNQVFQETTPGGSTATHLVLQARLDAYFARKAKGCTKSVCLICFTDGAPEDQQKVADVIVAATKRMDRDEEIAIEFVQVGLDGEATKFLQWLDDGLVAKGAKFDIVDTVKIADVEDFTPEQLLEKAFAD